MKTMLIKAKPGLRIPRPENARRYVEGDNAVEVDVSTHEKRTYWHRRIEHGEAELVTASPAKAKE